MNAREKQVLFIKDYLNPLLKRSGYHNKGTSWRRWQNGFYIVIDLRNYSKNKDYVDFCFKIGITVKARIKEAAKNRTRYYNLSISQKEDYYLPDERQAHSFRHGVGYRIMENNDLDDFVLELFNDFHHYILPKLEKLRTLKACLEYYRQQPTISAY